MPFNDTFTPRKYIRESNLIEDVEAESAIESSLEAWNNAKNREHQTHSLVEDIHQDIMAERQPEIAGRYRSRNVYIGGRTAPHPDRVAELMEKLLAINPKTPEETVDWHVTFEYIHPFADGNGRAGRMLYWWQCRKLDIEPTLWISEERQKYYRLFKDDAESRLLIEI